MLPTGLPVPTRRVRRAGVGYANGGGQSRRWCRSCRLTVRVPTCICDGQQKVNDRDSSLSSFVGEYRRSVLVVSDGNKDDEDNEERNVKDEDDGEDSG